MASKQDLKNYVNLLNDKYCKNIKNHFAIEGAYGGYQVVLTGKTYKRGSKTHYYKNSLKSAAASVTHGFFSPTTTLNKLYKADSSGYVKEKLKQYK